MLKTSNTKLAKSKKGRVKVVSYSKSKVDNSEVNGNVVDIIRFEIMRLQRKKIIKKCLSSKKQ